MKCLVGIAAIVLLVCSGATPASAQETTGTITGTVLDAQGGVIPGATVTITGAQGVKTATTNTDGRFSVPFLTPGTYSIKASLTGFTPVEQKNIILSVGQTLDLPFKLQPGGVSETVTVAAGTPTIDTTSTTTGAVISNDFAKSVPVGRRVSDMTYLAPGVSDSGSVGRSNPSIAGGSGLDNQYVIDGVNVTNQGYGALGSYSIIFGSLGNATPFDFVQEVQVKTGGYQAEYGQSIGGVVNVITKSGSNTLRGEWFGYSSPDSLEGAYKQFQSINGTVQTLGTHHMDTGASGGGAVIRNKIFFFGSIDGGWDTTTLQAPDDFPLRSLGGVDRDRRSTSYAAKGTVQLTPNQRIDASFFGDPSTGDLGPQRVSSLTVADTTSFSSLTYGGHNQSVRYNGAFGSRWLVEGTLARALNSINESPSVDQWRVTDQTVTPQVITGGVGFYEKGNRSLDVQMAGTATTYLSDHQLKFGVQYDDVTYSQVNQRTGPTFLGPDGRMTATGAEISILPDINFGQIYRVSRANYNSGRETRQQFTSLFVQDTWRVGNRLTINPGLRYEQETLDGTIVSGFSLKNNWAPRVGATYELTKDGKTKAYGSFGRFYARMPNDLAARSLSADDGISRADYFDAALTQPIPDGTVTQTPTGAAVTQHFQLAGQFPDTIDPNAKMSYIDEYSFGAEREVLPNTSLGVRYIHRDIGRVLEDVANVPMVAYDLGVPGVGNVEYILTNPSSSTPIFDTAQFLGAHFDDPVHIYKAVEVTLNRRMTNHWSLMSSYRWSRLRGNFEGFYRDDNGQSDPGITSLYDFPTNDPSYTAIGVPQFGYSGDIRYLGQIGILPLDRPHQVKVFGNYTWDNGLSIGIGANLSSGKPLTPLAANPNYTNGGEIPTAPRGSGIQTIDGFQTRTPMYRQIDLQAAYDLKFGKTRVSLFGQVFNVLGERRTVDYDAFTELEFGVPNPDFGSPISQNVAGPQFQAPRQVTLGARIVF
jgi:Carboxypeptidase regulatory-like domain/TonB dependent receptor-like, beta-barrel